MNGSLITTVAVLYSQNATVPGSNGSIKKLILRI